MAKAKEKAKEKEKEKDVRSKGALARGRRGQKAVVVKEDNFRYEEGFGFVAFQLACYAVAIALAYDIRLFAIKEYGLVIHEFDPWFNYRATEYLEAHGMKAFFEWFDHASWYPLGRPVGSTIYPGMQIIAVGLYRALNAAGIEISLNDTCCYFPAWFGAVATVFTGLLASECSGSRTVGAYAALVMAIIPAHIMRSVGGGYDNESLAVSAMVITFYFWCRSLRNNYSWPFGIIAGLAYINMVAAWGGYIFVLNMIGLHAGALVLLGRFSVKLQLSFSLFYIVGTLGAIQVPVVGLAPLKSLEQLGPAGVFGLLQLCGIVEFIRKRYDLDDYETGKVRVKVFGAGAALALIAVVILYPTGYFGPLSSRIRGLFVPHTRTGNPLVDSVAEHKAASPRAYYQYLNMACYMSPIGFFMIQSRQRDETYFLILYAIASYYFSAKMVRLIILLGPIASCLTGVALYQAQVWILDQVKAELMTSDDKKEAKEKTEEATAKPTKKKGKKKKKKDGLEELSPELADLKKNVTKTYDDSGGARLISALFLVVILAQICLGFYRYSRYVAQSMSNPSLMYYQRLSDGRTVLIDDYREAYWWLRDNTPEDSRVMAWWDYGYQINGIANRTTIADGNTWNHEHIATLGRCLVSPEEKAHAMVRHLADYVLVWSGGGGDDLAKSPHIARISNSVYAGICGDDPLCRNFGFDPATKVPTEMMSESLIYKLHSGGVEDDVEVNPKLFTNVFNSKYGKVRIWKVEGVSEESKRWSMDPKNYVCDAPGSWLCRGQYPPAMRDFLKDAKNFQQLEDFNVKRSKEADDYQKKYHEAMSGRGKKPQPTK